MRHYICSFFPFDEKLRRMPDRDAYQITFRFDLIPREFLGQADEAQHTERRSICITASGPSFFDGGIPSNGEDMVRVLYWHARKTLERGETSLHIDPDYVTLHRVDPRRIVFPPDGPFEVVLTTKMGFHA